ncbi:MAG: thioredoxin [Aquificaceae bacterium]|nr:thioredoxin [Aquificaceae bacterium]MDW8237628.1 thioredoxin [Aquificaceae bacterium]
MFEGFEELEDKNIYETAIAGEKPCVIVFYIPGNERNEKLAEVLLKYQRLYGDKVGFYAVDSTKNTSAEDLGIFTFPTVLYFRDSMELERHDYIPSEPQVERAIRRLLRL